MTRIHRIDSTDTISIDLMGDPVLLGLCELCEYPKTSTPIAVTKTGEPPIILTLTVCGCDWLES